MKYVIVFLLVAFISSSSFARSHHLFTLQLKTPNYYVDRKPVLGLYVDDQIVKKGDELVLDTGEIIHFKKFLGSGHNTLVVLDQNNIAVRLTQAIDSRSMIMFLGFLETYFYLKNHLPEKHLVQVLNQQPKSSYATYVEWLPIEENLYDYLNSYFDRSSKKFSELIDFFESFRGIDYIGDFTPGQIGYVYGRGWVLFDFGVGVRFNSSPDAKSSAVINQNDFKIFIRDKNVIKVLEEELKIRDTTYLASKSRSCDLFLID